MQRAKKETKCSSSINGEKDLPHLKSHPFFPTEGWYMRAGETMENFNKCILKFTLKDWANYIINTPL